MDCVWIPAVSQVFAFQNNCLTHSHRLMVVASQRGRKNTGTEVGGNVGNGGGRKGQNDANKLKDPGMGVG